MMLDGRAQATGIRRPGEDASLLLVFNSHSDIVEFTLPEPAGGGAWQLLVDTNLDQTGEGAFRPGREYKVTDRSFLLFALSPSAGSE
jgi:glycogen operon protein